MNPADILARAADALTADPSLIDRLGRTTLVGLVATELADEARWADRAGSRYPAGSFCLEVAERILAPVGAK